MPLPSPTRYAMCDEWLTGHTARGLVQHGKTLFVSLSLQTMLRSFSTHKSVARCYHCCVVARRFTWTGGRETPRKLCCAVLRFAAVCRACKHTQLPHFLSPDARCRARLLQQPKNTVDPFALAVWARSTHRLTPLSTNIRRCSPPPESLVNAQHGGKSPKLHMYKQVSPQFSSGSGTDRGSK